MKIDVPYSFLVRDGAFAWSCGQLAMDRNSSVIAPFDLEAQSDCVCSYIEELLSRARLSPSALRRLYLYVAPTNPSALDLMLSLFRTRFGGQVLLDPIPVPHFYYDGVMLEVDMFCAEGTVDTQKQISGGLCVETVTAAGMTWMRVEAPIEALPGALRDLEAILPTHGHLLSEQWLAPSAEARAASELLAQNRSLYVADSLVLKGVKNRIISGLLTLFDTPSETCMPQVTRHGDVDLMVRRAGPFAWLQAKSGGADGALVDQTEQLMSVLSRALAGMNMDFQSVVKSTTHYVGDASAADLHENMAVRNRCYTKPGPASTGVPVLGFSDPKTKIVVDLLALPISD
ncbi:MAG: hypothetical protein AAGI13_03665 [Pseudomonadota bacterium]